EERTSGPRCARSVTRPSAHGRSADGHPVTSPHQGTGRQCAGTPDRPVVGCHRVGVPFARISTFLTGSLNSQMHYDEIEHLRARHTAWALVNSRNVALVLSFLGRVFVDANAGSVPESRVVSELDDELFAL